MRTGSCVVTFVQRLRRAAGCIRLEDSRERHPFEGGLAEGALAQQPRPVPAAIDHARFGPARRRAAIDDCGNTPADLPEYFRGVLGGRLPGNVGAGHGEDAAGPPDHLAGELQVWHAHGDRLRLWVRRPTE